MVVCVDSIEFGVVIFGIFSHRRLVPGFLGSCSFNLPFLTSIEIHGIKTLSWVINQAILNSWNEGLSKEALDSILLRIRR